MPASPKTQFRTDIEGLRGLAIALVVIFHVFIGKVSSGVDVFLLLGGIFFFSSQLTNAQRPDGLTPIQSLIRIIRRLFPLLAVVVASTLAGVFFVMSKLQHITMAKDAVAALGYYINWQLAYSGREYTNVRNEVSPFQHLWSMSAQLQIYVASLLAVVIIAFIFRRLAKPALLIILTAATILSFAYATYLNQHDQALNYYSTFSRFWEIGLGGLLGMWLLRKPKDGGSTLAPISTPMRWVLGLLGLTAIICTGAFLNGAQQFPGPWTLIPLLGAACVVIAGTGGQPVGVTRLLETKLFQFLGRISYALYLWHWPILVLVVAWLGQQQETSPTNGSSTGLLVNPVVGVGVIVTSVVLAWLSSRLVEKPLRQGAKPQRSWVLLHPSYWWASIKRWPKTIYATGILLLAGAVVATPIMLEQQIRANSSQLLAKANNRDDYPGALAYLNDAPVPEGVTLIPSLEDFQALLPPTQADGCQIGFEPAIIITHKNYNRSDEECAYGDIDSQRTMYVIGGSHSEQYIPAMDIIGKNQGIKMVPLLKMGCPVGATIPLWTGEDYPSCREWSAAVMKYILDNPPTEGIFMIGTRPSDYLGRGPEIVPPEYVDVVRRFDAAGIRSYLVRDNPWHMKRNPDLGQFDQRRCVTDMMDGSYAGNGDPVNDGSSFPGFAVEDKPTASEIDAVNQVCGNAVEESLLPLNPEYEAYAGLNVRIVDLTLGYCKDGWCPSIIGNVVVYRDAHHFTNVFTETLAPELERQMFAQPALPPAPPLVPHVAFPDGEGAPAPGDSGDPGGESILAPGPTTGAGVSKRLGVLEKAPTTPPGADAGMLTVVPAPGVASPLAPESAPVPGADPGAGAPPEPGVNPLLLPDAVPTPGGAAAPFPG